ncbi:MAG: YggU family protein [Actinobacteria bacterium]|nr:YggU family protein [Actinomycetota bacterium]
MAEGEGFLRWSPDGALLDVRLRPGSSRSALLGVQDGRLVIAVHSPPQQGRANREALRLLSRLVRVPPSRMEITSGQNSRNKTVLVRGVSESEIAMLSSLLEGADPHPSGDRR